MANVQFSCIRVSWYDLGPTHMICNRSDEYTKYVPGVVPSCEDTRLAVDFANLKLASGSGSRETDAVKSTAGTHARADV